MRPRNPQLSLRLNSAPTSQQPQWEDGSRIRYLGRDIILRLSKDSQETTLVENALNAALPPEASPRQIQDSVEAWLQLEALNLFNAISTRKAKAHGTMSLPCVLSFAAKNSWVVADEGCLRCNWKLIEQPMNVIEKVIGTVVAGLPLIEPIKDLFGYDI